jgi:hypothetical protein
MPLNKYFKGHGSEVMSKMKKQYGSDAKKVFYATANKRGLDTGPSSSVKKKHGVK